MMKTLHSALFKFTLIIFAFSFLQTAQAADAAKGKQIFETNCTACHKLGEVLIGPNLVGVKSRWKDESKLHAFIKNSQAVIATDAYAKGLYAKFNVLMPPQDLSDEQIADVVAYVDGGGTSAPAPGGGGDVASAPASGGSYAPVPADDSWMRYLVVGIIILLIVIFLLSSRLLKNVFGLNVTKEDDSDDHKSGKSALQKINAYFFPIFFIVWFGLMGWELSAHLKYMRPEAASDTGQEIDRLFHLTLIVTTIVFVLTQVLLFYYSFRYRYKEGKKGYYYPHNNTIEFIWTSIPAVVLAALVLYGFKTWQKATGNPDNRPITIEAFAKQFDWTYRYPGPDGKLGRTDFMKIDPGSNPLGLDFTDPASQDDYLATELHLPVNHDIYLKLRSQDVTHAAYLPHFRAQMYANPGMDTRLRFKPIITTAEMRKKINNPEFNYEMACNQLCGAAHFNMRRVVVVENDAEFMNWQKDKKPAYDKVKDQIKTASK